MTVDDVHQADLPSLQSLAYLVRRLRNAQVLLVFTESSLLMHAFSTAQAELLRSPHLCRVPVGPLSRSGLEILAEDRASGVDELYSRTGGNLLLAQALLGGDGPPARSGEGGAGDAYDEAVADCLFFCV